MTKDFFLVLLITCVAYTLKITVVEVGFAPRLARQDLKTQDKTRSCLATPVLQDRQDLVCKVRGKLHVLVEGGARSVWLVFSSRQNAIGINISEFLHPTTV